MKKILIYFSCVMIVILLSGCSMENTPTKKVEKFLNNYTSRNDVVLNQLKEMVDSDTMMDDDQRNTYSTIMKRQYKDMTYEIKDETINGNDATVTAEIEVYDYYKANKDSEEYYNSNRDEFTGVSTNNKDAAVNNANPNDDVSTAEGYRDVLIENNDSKYIEYRLEQLKKTKERVKYTVDFYLTKVEDEWKLNDIDDTTRQKIHGLYEH